MPRRGASKTSNAEKYKRVKQYADKLQSKTDDIAAKIKELYENNVWDLKTKFENLEEIYKDNSTDKDISWIQGVQYMDYKKKPRVTKKISLKKFKSGEYKTTFVEKPNTIPTEANYAKRIEFYTKTFQPFKKYEGKDDISWVVYENHTLLYEVMRYNNGVPNTYMSLNKDMKTILRTIRLHLGNTHELTYKFSALSTSLSDLASRRDGENRVETDREISQFIKYVDLIRLVEQLEAEYNEELNTLPPEENSNGSKHSNRLYHMHQMQLLVALYVYDYPSRNEKMELSFITNEKNAKPDRNHILVRDKLDCKLIFNEIKKRHNAFSYVIKTDTPVISGFNKKLNKLIKYSFKTYPRDSVLIGKSSWEKKDLKAISAGTAAKWLRDIFKGRNLSVNTFRSSFVSYYVNDVNINLNQKKEMALKMRTSTTQIDESYRKDIRSPEQRYTVKLEEMADEEETMQASYNISTGTSRDNPVNVYGGEQIRAAIPIREAVAPIAKPKPKNTHERKRKAFQTYYQNEDNKKKHDARVKKHSSLPSTYAKRIVRELNNGMINIKNLQPTTIAKYGIKKEGDLWTYNLPK